MPFVFKKLLDHGTTNPIVARLSLQVLQILDQCTLVKGTRDKIGELYVNSLQRKLLRCWEIEERFRNGFNAAIESYKPPAAKGGVEIPQVPRLEEESHNFLYEAKNYVRDLLAVVNLLHGSDFREASEFTRGKKGSRSLVQYAAQRFGDKDSKTLFLREAAGGVEELINFRNAVEHPGGYSGTLRIENFSLDPDGRIAEPAWHREKDGQPINPPSAIRSDMVTTIENLLTLGEDVLVSWAVDNLKAPRFMRLAIVRDDRRDPSCPIKWVVTASQHIEEQIKMLERKN